MDQNCQAFITEDPFNPGNTLEGTICRTSNKMYGALTIDRVNRQGATLRFISQYFDKKRMSRVGSVILGQAGLLNPKGRS